MSSAEHTANSVEAAHYSGDGLNVNIRRTPSTNAKPALDISTEALSWEDLANCKGADTDKFFPERGKSTKAAKAICAQCVVREECLDYAITFGEKFGIWGGMSERERRRYKRETQLLERESSAG